MKRALVIFMAVFVMFGVMPQIVSAIASGSKVSSITAPYAHKYNDTKYVSGASQVTDTVSDASGTTTYQTCIQFSTDMFSWGTVSCIASVTYDASRYNNWSQTHTVKACGGGILHPIYYWRTRVLFNNEHKYSSPVGLKRRPC